MTRGKHEADPITNGREAVLYAIKELNRRIDSPLIERGFDVDDAEELLIPTKTGFTYRLGRP